MKIRRILATAVAAAVTTPVVLLSAAPAFADTKPAAGAEQQAGKSVKDLEIELAAAQAAHDKAIAAYKQAEFAAEESTEAVQDAKADWDSAKKDAAAAAAAKTAADQKLADARKALADLPADATQEQKDAAQKAVDDAQAAVDAAQADVDAKATSLESAKTSYDVLANESVAAFARLNAAKKAMDDALKAVIAAFKALNEAKKNLPGECLYDKKLVTSLTGPEKITAGSSGVFTFRVTNKGDKAYDEVGGLAAAFRANDDLGEGDDWTDPHLTLSWSSAASPKWRKVDPLKGFSGGVPLAAHKSVDFKLKVAYDAKTPAGEAAIGAVGIRVNRNGSCGQSKEGASVDFEIVKPHKPSTGTGKGDGKGDGKGNGSTGGNGNTSQQGGSSTTPVTTGTSGTTTTGGSLAKTGAGSSTLPIALTGGAAVVLGAGAMVVVRRRKAGADA